MGVGNDPRYQKATCFDAFPAPDPESRIRSRIADIAERIQQHRLEAMQRDERVTITEMYNVLDALRSGTPLSAKEQAIHRIAACGTLRDLHDDLDALVAETYGWEWPLESDEILARLVALHDARAVEEEAGQVRWLRPSYQRPHFGADIEPPELTPTRAEPEIRADQPSQWPTSTVDQIEALQAIIARRPCTVEEAARRFVGARRDMVARHSRDAEPHGRGAYWSRRCVPFGAGRRMMSWASAPFLPQSSRSDECCSIRHEATGGWSHNIVNGTQWVCFVVRPALLASSRLQSPDVWNSFVGADSRTVHYWGKSRPIRTGTAATHRCLSWISGATRSN